MAQHEEHGEHEEGARGGDVGPPPPIRTFLCSSEKNSELLNFGRRSRAGGVADAADSGVPGSGGGRGRCTELICELCLVPLVSVLCAPASSPSGPEQVDERACRVLAPVAFAHGLQGLSKP